MATKKSLNTNTNDKQYEEFLRHLGLIDLGLIKSSSEFDPAAYAQLQERKGKNVRQTISANYKLDDIGEKYFDSVAEFNLAVEMEKTNVKPVVIECIFLGHFHCEAPLVKDLAERFTNSDFRLVVWPYFRQFVHDISAKMSIPPVIVPLGSGER